VDKNVSETFSLIESAVAPLKEPPIYETTRANLLAYRNKVMTDLIGGRVIALLDAGHDSMAKYKEHLSSLNAIGYLFKNLRHNALAIRFKGLDIGLGKYKGIATSFDAPISTYPLQEPYNVPPRSLPQVDYFKFVPHDDLTTGNVTNLAQLKAFCRVQSDKDAFIDPPEMENSLNDFFFFYPECKVRGRWMFVDPVAGGYVAWNGERIAFMRELRTGHEEMAYEYSMYVWLNADVERTVDSVETREACPAIQVNYTSRREHNVWYRPSNAPEIEYGVGGQSVKSSNEQIFAMTPVLGGAGGITPVFIPTMVFRSLSWDVDTEEVVWYNHWTTIIEVNNPDYGTTDPVPDTYTDKALDGYEIEAQATPPHTFDHWEIDGVNIGSINPYFHYPLKDVTIKAVFTA
jgi:hypothetical protein